jgi:hypothetical protein
MMPPKESWKREYVRIGRRRGWARAAIVKEPVGWAYVVLLEHKTLGNLREARKVAKEALERMWPVESYRKAKGKK